MWTVFLAVNLIIGVEVVCGQNPGTTRDWDISLMSLSLSNVQIQAESLPSAWQNVAKSLFLRTVLYSTGGTDGRFSFSSKQCTVQELLRALASTYNYALTQDDRTGVIWIHPKSIPFTNILTNLVEVRTDQYGVPMWSEIVPALSLITPYRWRGSGITWNNTFSYPVDLPKGTYSVRDVLNLCCVANPSKTFYVSQTDNRPVEIQPYNIISSDVGYVQPGALHFWELEIGPLHGNVPADDEVIDKLADTNAQVRWAASVYLESELWHYLTQDEWPLKIASPERALWATLGVSRWLARSNNAPFPGGAERLRKECTKDFLIHSDPKLAILAATELDRLEHDPKGLELLSKRQISSDDVAQIRSRLSFGIRTSASVKEAMTKNASCWPGFGTQEVEQLGNGNIFYPVAPPPSATKL
jgi:hypothetical protein